MRITTFLAFSLMIFGVIGVVAARYFALAKGVRLGIFAIGAGVLIGALESIYMRRMSLRASNEAAAAYDGIPAVIWGLMLLLIAGCVIGAAYAMDAGRWGAVTAYLNQRPGALYGLSGLLLMGVGALAFVNPHGMRVWWKTLLFRVPRVSLGVLLMLAGLIALACGVWEWIDPRDFQKASRVILSIIESTLPDGLPRAVFRRLRQGT
ncbi:MAG: hypothetical protein ABL891_09315 [Burkholderiales bacterium]